MAIISVTRLRLRSVLFLPSFLWYTRRSVQQAQRTPGNLGVRIRRTKGLVFWTLAMWRDNQAIRAFVPASPHREAVRSEERRVGKECRSRGWAYQYKKKRSD